MITEYDLKLIQQKPIHFIIILEVLKDDGKTVLDTLKGTIIGGSSSIDSSSSIRRTFSATIIPTLYDRNDTRIIEDGLIWLNKEIRMYIGIMDIRTKEYKYYPQGHYVYTSTSGTYDAATNQLTISCSDYMSKLDGTKNGQLGALKTLIPAYDENPDTGEVIRYNIIRDAIVTILKDLGTIQNYMVDDVGEYKALPPNENWKTYRQNNPRWNVIPYDLEFSSGCTVLSILEKLRDLYPNYEMYFDEYNTFICKMIPSCYRDRIIIPNDIIQQVLISESKTIDMSKVRNICEVWGKVIDADFYTEQCTYTNNTYNCTIEGYDEQYYNADLIAIKINARNVYNSTKLNINGLGVINILNENDNDNIKASTLDSNTVYIFKIKSKRTNGNITYDAYLLGHWQSHGLNVLTDGTVGENFTFNDGVVHRKYSMEYFQKKYNCESVEFEIIQNSPFTVQKLGEILDVKSGGEYENITSDSLALTRAKWENWRNCRLTDNITITTNLIPFYDVNIKISYQNSQSEIPEQYIIKSVSHDFSSFTSTLSLIKFYPLYYDVVKEMGIHRVLSNYKHGTLAKYTHDELTTIIGGDTL